MLKKFLCTLMCLTLMLSTACAAKAPAQPPAATDAPANHDEIYVPEAPVSDEPAEEEPVYLSESSEAYRELYSENPIEAALDERFSTAVTVEDFEALAADYRAAWQSEYHALMAKLMELYPDDADELSGLVSYTDEEAQAAFDAAYAQHIYIAEDGTEQPAAAAQQNGDFAMAEVYKDATVLSILNDYREEENYTFHYTAQ